MTFCSTEGVDSGTARDPSDNGAVLYTSIHYVLHSCGCLSNVSSMERCGRLGEPMTPDC